MTIKDFARLCGCNPQTLRYYDHEDLLKPVAVDRWSGYRYYEEEQALAFVKIKNLQKAGFTIEEIKGLLDQDNAVVYRAFAAKIAEAEQRLQEIKTIRKSYQTEMSTMEQKIEEIRERVQSEIKAYDPGEEFGIDEETYQQLIQGVTDFFEQLAKDGYPGDYDFQEYTDGEEVPEEYPDLLDDPNYALVCERHGWAYAREFLDECMNLQDGLDYQFVFRLVDGKASGTAFCNVVVGLAVMKNGKDPEHKRSLGCSVSNSTDGQNHFWLFKRIG